jgi:hypothetical protein
MEEDRASAARANGPEQVSQTGIKSGKIFKMVHNAKSKRGVTKPTEQII